MASDDAPIAQAEPTRSRPVDDAGQLLDEHGLPINGPGRAEALAGAPDPALAEPAPDPTPPATGEGHAALIAVPANRTPADAGTANEGEEA